MIYHINAADVGPFAFLLSEALHGATPKGRAVAVRRLARALIDLRIIEGPPTSVLYMAECVSNLGYTGLLIVCQPPDVVVQSGSPSK